MMTRGPPNAQEALVEEKKIIGYLLNTVHPDGAGKPRFFSSLGFTLANWQQLADALTKQAFQNQVSEVVESSYGNRNTVAGEMMTPGGRKPDSTDSVDNRKGPISPAPGCCLSGVKDWLNMKELF